MNTNIIDIEEQGDDLILTVDLPQRKLRGDDVSVPHRIIVPRGAILNRMRDYGLGSQHEAIRAIVREHAKRLNDLPDGDEDVPMNRRNAATLRRAGGLRKDVTVDASVQALGKMVAFGLNN